MANGEMSSSLCVASKVSEQLDRPLKLCEMLLSKRIWNVRLSIFSTKAQQDSLEFDSNAITAFRRSSWQIAIWSCRGFVASSSSVSWLAS